MPLGNHCQSLHAMHRDSYMELHASACLAVHKIRAAEGLRANAKGS